MSVKYTPVQWNANKLWYDAVVVGLLAAYVLIFLRFAPEFQDHARPVDGAIVRARAFGSAAFFMLTAILCIGPLARLDKRFLPLLYNRRHFGVIVFFVALTHVMFVLNWYFAFSPTPKIEALFAANTAYGLVYGFPFETLGAAALVSLAVLAATSHDFWLAFLGPRLWKLLHWSVYIAYAAVVGHVALGILATQSTSPLTWAVVASVVLVCGLHLAAALTDRAEHVRRAGAQDAPASDGPAWVPVCDLDEIVDGRARIIRLGNGERVAVFRNAGTLSAISNACAHQNGPLGEGRIIDGCVTCPWHGFQYNVVDGRSPAPFTETVPTYRLRLDGRMIEVDPQANPPGTRVEPVAIPDALLTAAGPAAQPGAGG